MNGDCDLGYARSASKDLERLPAKIVEQTLEASMNWPWSLVPMGSVKIKGEESTYRIRVGHYRVIYEVFDDELRVVILHVRHRKDAYRGF